MKNKKRYISLLLCLSMLLSMIVHSIPTVMAAEESVEITFEGQKIEDLTIEQSSKEILSAVTSGMETPSFQWQILLDPQSSVWVDIYDRTEADCEVSYALVKNMLDDANSTYVRCAATSAGETVYSNEVCVTVSPERESAPQVTSFALTRYVATETSEAAEVPTMFSMARNATTEYVTITVKYLDIASLGGTGEAAIYSPYTATIEHGTSFKQSVVSPTFLGFAPYLDSNNDGVINDNDQSAATLNLDYPSVTENIEIKVYYKPIEVNFAVKYFFQKINDDLYIEDAARYHTGKAETGTIVTNDYLLSHAGNTTGFTKMYHIPESVAADGSTVFECYYDRNYYLIQFDLNGGYGVEPIYARYGTPFVVNNPIRHGYTFAGWNLVGVDTNGNGEWDDAFPDGVSSDLVSTIPSYNYRYQAQWETVDTEYTVVYWLDDNYLGSRIVSEKSGEYVSGSDDLDTAKICGVAEHTHSEENGCYGNCTETEHVCDLSCYTTYTLDLADNQEGTVATVYGNLKDAVGTPTEGNVYKYAYTYWPYYYNFFYYNGAWYYLGTRKDYDYISVSGLTDPNRNSYNTVAATKICSAGSHIHTDACLSCEDTEHTHNDACEIDATYYVYKTADTNVLVEGDGSTVVNVYYKPKEYTLRFYYAATTGTGTDEDSDGIAETYDSVKIIGGSTYSFGKDGTNTSDDETLLNAIFNTATHAGTVTKLPQLNTEGKSRSYTLGTITSGYNTYHYIEFTAGYGQNISDLWPCAVFESATRETKNTHANWSGTEAFVSAWNGEHHVWYSQNNPNQTIKGKYEKLDYKLLFDASKFTDETTVSYLCFWENGANIGWSVPELYRYNIWVPVLTGESTDDLETKKYNGVTYKLIDSYDTCDDSDVNNQTQPALEGYTANGYDSSKVDFDNTLYSAGYNVNFYYKREKNPFAMKNHGEYLANIKVDESGSGGVAYGTQLSALNELNVLGDNFTPPYPSTLEENAYYFEGWYTTEQCIPGTKVDLSSATMPASGLILYANWVPETHTARFFTTYDEMLSFESNTSNNVHYSSDVKHGEIVGTVETPVLSGDGTLELTFAGWFYMENGQKKAFSPLNIPISRDINVFAEWSSHSPQPYLISYVLRKDPNTKVADDTNGFAYGGSTRTFNAKAGDPYNQLYDQYNKGFFPTVSSHSITIQAEADKDHPEHNIFTFYYVNAENITYTVRYVNKETNVVMDTETYTTTSAVVTKRFKAYPNMVPDAFYKRLILDVKEDENGNWVGTENNVITFYYTPNDTSAYYAVHFMLEKLGATDEDRKRYDISGNGGYEETGTHIEGVGKIGSTVYISPQTMAGFSLIEGDKVPIILSDGKQSTADYSSENGGYGIEITQSGTELYLFYERNEYPYQVHYYEYNTTKSLETTKEGNAYYGSDVTETAEKVDGYTCVSEQAQTITIREDDGSQGLNVIVFYYAPKQYVAEYVAVPDDGGWLSNTIEVISGTDDLTGSVPTANQYYEFDGWYLDEACTQSVTAEYGTVNQSTNCFVPDKTKLSETERNIFYAKFVKKVGDLTIDRGSARDTDQVFVYEIKNNDTGEVIYVTITGNGITTIKDLPLGNYTVTQQNDWSWRYADAPAENVDHQNANGTTVPFGKAEQTEQWLNGNSLLVKNQRGQ